VEASGFVYQKAFKLSIEHSAKKIAERELKFYCL